MGNLKKGSLEKVYTPKELTLFMIDRLNEFYTDEITEFFEPAAGDGKIIDVLYELYPNTPVLAVDIFNESNREDIYQYDFLKLPVDYKKGRVIIMNPPFTKAIAFLKKCRDIADFVVSITGVNTFITLDYNEFDVKQIDIFNKYKFCNNKKYAIAVISLKKGITTYE